MAHIKTEQPSTRAQAIRKEVLDLLIKRSAEKDIPPQQILAILAYTVGQCILMLDQTKFTPEMAMEIVNRNILKGNTDALKQAMDQPTAGSA